MVFFEVWRKLRYYLNTVIDSWQPVGVKIFNQNVPFCPSNTETTALLRTISEILLFLDHYQALFLHLNIFSLGLHHLLNLMTMLPVE